MKYYCALLMATLLLSACSGNAPLKAKFLPERGRLLILGQDLLSVREFQQSDCCPTPAGITTYLGLYNLIDESTAFGGLGIDIDGRPVEANYDGGGGVMNAYKASREFPHSSLVIGLNITENGRPGYLQKILDGQQDQQIQQLGQLIKTVNVPVFLRIGYEFDGAWNQGYQDQQRYISVFQYIVDELRSSNVTNIATVWQASTSPVDDILDGKHEDIRGWYPGDAYVDWMGLSWFLGADEQPQTEQALQIPTQKQLADELLSFARHQQKPVMVAESAPQGYDLSELNNRDHVAILDGPSGENQTNMSAEAIWQAWFAPFFAYIDDNADVIRAVAYINADWDAQSMWGPPYKEGYWGDSRVQKNPQITRYWLEATSGQDWLDGSDDLFERLGFQSEDQFQNQQADE